MISFKPETYYDERTGQGPCNTMSMSWALQGFLGLHEATGEQHFLEAAESVADSASLFQAAARMAALFTLPSTWLSNCWKLASKRLATSRAALS